MSNARFTAMLLCGAPRLVCVQVAVGDDEPQDNAVKRFRRAVMGTGLIQEVRQLC